VKDKRIFAMNLAGQRENGYVLLGDRDLYL